MFPIPSGPTLFKDRHGHTLPGKPLFEELIGILADDGSDLFYAHARIADGRFFCTRMSKAGPNTIYMRPWLEVEEASSLAMAMEAGKHWAWVHKKIGSHDNWQLMKKCMAWAIANHLGQKIDAPIEIRSDHECEV